MKLRSGFTYNECYWCEGWGHMSDLKEEGWICNDCYMEHYEQDETDDWKMTHCCGCGDEYHIDDMHRIEEYYDWTAYCDDCFDDM